MNNIKLELNDNIVNKIKALSILNSSYKSLTISDIFYVYFDKYLNEAIIESLKMESKIQKTNNINVFNNDSETLEKEDYDSNFSYTDGIEDDSEDDPSKENHNNKYIEKNTVTVPREESNEITYEDLLNFKPKELEKKVNKKEKELKVKVSDLRFNSKI